MKALLLSDEIGFRAVLPAALPEVLEAEMTEALGAGKSERTAERVGYRSGYNDRTLITRAGFWRCGFRRTGRVVSRQSCSSGISGLRRRWFRRWRRCMFRVSRQRKVKAITEELCGHSVSATTISAATRGSTRR